MSDSSGFSRRDLLGGAGMTAGALAALGATLPMLGASAGAQAAVKRTIAGMSLALEIDGAVVGLLTGADGGGFAAQKIQTGAQSAAKSANFALGTYIPKPLTLTFSSGIPAKDLEWVAARESVPRSVDVVLFESTTGANEIYRLSMRGTRVANFGISKLDVASSDPLEFFVTLQPDQATHVYGRRTPINLPLGLKAKTVRGGFFRFFIQGLEQATQQTRVLENISFARAIRPDVIGQSRDSVVNSVGSFSIDTLRASMPLASAGPLYQWLTDILKGKPPERAGQIQFLSLDQKSTLATIDLTGLQPMSVSTPFDGAASSDRIDMVSIDLAVADIRFNLKDLGG